MRFNVPERINDLQTALFSAGVETFVVGGAVRDMISGRKPHDFDMATPETPDRVKAACGALKIRTISDLGEKHGTVAVVTGGEVIEITTFRTDSGYSDKRHPDSVSFTDTIEEDVKRRDFTMNSLYLDKDGNVRDAVGGVEDINARIIRAVGDPDIRFKEDALRILRAVRFASKLGFAIEDKTAEAMKRNAILLKDISAERIKTELDGIVTGEHAPEAIRDNVEVLSVIIPELLRMKGFDQKSRFHHLDMLEHTLKVLENVRKEKDGYSVILSYGALLHDIGKPDCFFLDDRGVGHMTGHPKRGEEIVRELTDRLKFPTDQKRTIARLVLLHDEYGSGSRKEVSELMRNEGAEFTDLLLSLQRADLEAHAKVGSGREDRYGKTLAMRARIEEEKLPYRISDLAVKGDDIIAAGVSSGEKVGRILNELLEAVIEEKIPNTAEELLKYVEKLRDL